MNILIESDNISFIKRAISCGVPFAMWSMPQTAEVNRVYCSPTQLIKTYSSGKIDNSKGFIFSPFHVCKHLPVYIIPFGKEDSANFDECQGKRTTLIADESKFVTDIKLAEKIHLLQVNKFLSVFETSDMKKAVLSRNKWLSNYSSDDMADIFEVLRTVYPNAFVYQVFIPGAGYWVGATPELLFSLSGGEAKTVSLAGTQPFTEHVSWTHKELVEQELVTEHIRQVLKESGIENFREKGPVTTKAGELAHLKTEITFNTGALEGCIGSFIEQLHPTPAVCGLPVKDALELILETEGYDREYYTGYLGVFDADGDTNLFVNLRCLQAFDNGVLLYAGGGITAESDAEKEWEETRLKIRSLERVLNG